MPAPPMPMIFLPVGILIFIAFILALPLLLVLGYFKVVTLGFERLGFPNEAVVLIFFLMLVGSLINIPLTRKKIFSVEERSFFGLFRKRKLMVSGLSINLGGAVIPILISLYFLTKVPTKPVLIATLLMIIISKFLAKVVPGKGIRISAIFPSIFAVFFAYILAPEFTASCAFISGVFGTIIGADILNIRKIQRTSPGMLSIGGAGVFDGIFLIGIISALFS